MVTMDPLSAVIQIAIDKEPACRRLYPDLYAAQVAEAVRKFLDEEESEHAYDQRR